MRLALAAAFAGATLLLAVWPAGAQDVVLSGTLQTVSTRGTLLIGVRQGAVPFAFANRAGQAIGFSVDLCRGIAADVAAALSRPLLDAGAPPSPGGIAMVDVPVTADARLPMLTEGKIDLECGSTTDTAARRDVVAFSPVFFLAGTRLLTARQGGVASYRDLKRVAVSKGTTNADVMHRLAARAQPPFTVVETADVPSAYDLLAKSEVDAVASDDVLLAGLVASRPDGQRFQLVGEFLSFEPYAIAFRRDDPAFAALVRQSFQRMASSGLLATRYRRWFVDTLPDGKTLDLPMSAQLTEMYRALGQPD